MIKLIRRILPFLNKGLVFTPIVVSVIFVVYLGFLTQGQTLFVHDSALYFTKSEAFSHFGNLWRSDSFGYADYLVQAVAFFSNLIGVFSFVLGMSFSYFQLLIFLIILLSIWYGSWYAFKKIFDLLELSETLYSSFFASILYTFNLYMIASWHGGTIDALFVVFAIAPSVLYLYILSLIRGMNIRISVLLGVMMGGFCLYAAPFTIALIVALSVSFILTSVRSNFFKNIKFLSFSFFIAGITGFVYLFLLVAQTLYFDPWPLRNRLDGYMFSGHGLFGVFRLFLEWTMNQSWGGRYFHSYYPYYTGLLPIISIFLLWAVSFNSLFVGIKKLRNTKKVSIFLLIVLLVSAFISKASQAPFGNLNMFLYEYIPFFNMFRTPDTKFGFPLILIFSCLVGYYLAISKKIVLRFVIVIAIILQIVPFFSATPIIEVKAGDEFQRMMVVPVEYENIKNIIDNDSIEGAVLFYPGSDYTNFDYGNGTGLNGQDILGKMIDRPIVYKNIFTFGKSEEIYNLLTMNPQGAQFNDYGIRYVFVRKDILHFSTEDFSSKIEKNKELERVYVSNLGDLYRLKTGIKSPVIVLQSNNDVYVEYDSKKDSSIQTIKVKNLRNESNLIFRQSFHQGWKIYAGTVNCQACLVWQESFFNNEHDVISDYANGWTIDPAYIRQNFPKDSYIENPDGSIDVDLTLYFKPQAYFYLGLIVSGMTSMLCLWYLVWDWRRRKKNKNGLLSMYK